MADNVKDLYDAATSNGVELPNYEEFSKDMQNPTNVSDLHSALKSHGFELPTVEEFTTDMIPKAPPAQSSISATMDQSNPLNRMNQGIGQNIGSDFGAVKPVDLTIPKYEYKLGDFSMPNDTPKDVIKREALAGLIGPDKLVGQNIKGLFTDDDLPVMPDIPKGAENDPNIIDQVGQWLYTMNSLTPMGRELNDASDVVAKTLKPAAGVFVSLAHTVQGAYSDIQRLQFEPGIKLLEYKRDQALKSGDKELAKTFDAGIEQLNKQVSTILDYTSGGKALSVVDDVMANTQEFSNETVGGAVVNMASSIGGELLATYLTLGASSLRIPTYARYLQGAKNPLTKIAPLLTNLEFGGFNLLHPIKVAGEEARAGGDASDVAKAYGGGLVDAWWWGSMGVPGHTIGSKISSNLTSKGIKWANSIGASIGTTVSAGIFTGEAAIKEQITTGEVTAKNILPAGIMAVAFGAKGQMDAAKMDVIDHQVTTHKLFMEGSDKFMELSKQTGIDPARVTISGVRENRMGVVNGENPATTMGRNAAVSKLVGVSELLNMTLSNPEQVKAMARESGVGEEVVVQRVNDLMDKHDPVSKEVREKLSKVDDLKRQVAELEANPSDISAHRVSALKGAITAEERGVATLFKEPFYFLNGKRYGTKEELYTAIDENPPSSKADLIVRNDQAAYNLAEKRVNDNLGKGLELFSESFSGKVNPTEVTMTPATAVSISRAKEGLSLSPEARENAKAEVAAELRFVDAALEKGVGKFFSGSKESALVYRTKLHEFSESLNTEAKDLPRKEQYEKETARVEEMPIEEMRASNSRDFAMDFMEGYDINSSHYLPEDFQLGLTDKQFVAVASNVKSYRQGMSELTPESEMVLQYMEKLYESGKEVKLPGGDYLLPDNMIVEATMSKVSRIKDKLDTIPDEVAEKVLGKTEDQIASMSIEDITKLYYDVNQRAAQEKSGIAESKIPTTEGVQAQEPTMVPETRATPEPKVEKVARVEKVDQVTTELLQNAEPTMRAKIKQVSERESAYRAEIIKSYKEADKSLSATVVPGLTQERIEVLGRIAASYARQGIKSADIMMRELAMNVKDLFGHDLTLDEYNKIMDTKIGDNTSIKDIMAEKVSKAQEMDIQKSIDESMNVARANPKVAMAELNDFKVSQRAAFKSGFRKAKAEAAEQKKWDKITEDFNKEIDKAKTDAEKNVLREKLATQKVKENFAVAFERKNTDKVQAKLNDVAQAKKNIAGFIQERKAWIESVAPDLPAGMLTKLNRVTTQEQADRYLDYMSNVLKKASTAKMVDTIEKNIDKVNKGLKTGKKFGTLSQMVRQLIDAPYDMIPMEKVSEYNLLMEKLGSSAIPEVGSKEMRDLLVDITNSIADITPVVNNIMEGQSGKLFRRMQESVSDINDQVVAEKILSDMMVPELSKKVMDITPEILVDGTRQFSPVEAEFLTQAKHALTPEMLGKFAPKELVKLNRLLDAVNEGGWISPKLYKEFVMKSAQMKAAKIFSEETKLSEEAFTTAQKAQAELGRLNKTYKEDRLKPLSKDEFAIRFKNSQKYLIDAVSGITKTDAAFQMTFAKFSAGETKIKSEYEPIMKKVHELGKALGTTNEFDKMVGTTSLFGRSQFDSQALMSMYAIARNDAANVGLPASLKDYMLHENLAQGSYSPDAQNRLTKLYEFLPKDENGTVDIARMKEEVLTKEERDFIDYHDQVNAEHTMPLIQHATTVFHGNEFRPLKEHVHINADRGSAQTSSENIVDQYMGEGARMNQPGFKAGAAKERVGATTVRFNLSKSMLESYHDALSDYHMSPIVHEVFGSMRLVRAGLKDSNSYAYIDALNEYVKNTVVGEHANEKYVPGAMDKFVREVMQNISTSTLASGARVFKELPSNLISAAFYPQEVALGVRNLDLIKSTLPDLMQWVGSEHYHRLGAMNMELEQQNIHEMMSPELNLKTTKAGQVAEVVGEGYQSLRTRGKKLGTSIITFSDNICTRPMWIGSFLREYKAKSGVDFNASEFTNNKDYRYENKDFLMAARAKADGNIRVLYNASSKYSIAEILTSQSRGALPVIGKAIMSFMRSYGYNDAANFANAMKAQWGEGTLDSRSEGARQMGMILARNYAYNLAATAIYGLTQEIMDEDKKADEVWKDMGTGDFWARNAIGALASVPMGKWVGPVKAFAGLGLEIINKNVTENLLDRKYNPYSDKLTYGMPGVMTDPRSAKSWLPVLGGLSMPTNTVVSAATVAPRIVSGRKLTQGMNRDVVEGGFNLLSTMFPLPMRKQFEDAVKLYNKSGKNSTPPQGLPNTEEFNFPDVNIPDVNIPDIEFPE